MAITAQLYFSSIAQSAPNRQSISEARQKVSWRVFEDLLQKLSTQNKYEEKWCGHLVRIIDGTQIRLPLTEELWATFGTSSSQHGSHHYPMAQATVLLSAFTGQPLDLAVARYDDSERALAMDLFPSLRKNDVVLLDRGLGG